jgi:DNA-binding response OmpR family regulator
LKTTALLGDASAAGLKQAGHAVDWARTASQRRAALAGEDYAAVVLDLGLPRKDGMEVLRGLRANASASCRC